MHRIIAALVSIIVIVSSANTFGQTPGTADYAAQVSTIQTIKGQSGKRLS